MRNLFMLAVICLGLIAQQAPPPPPPPPLRETSKFVPPPIRIGWSAQRHKLRRWVAAERPSSLGIRTGTVRLRVVISKIGTVQSMEIVSRDVQMAEPVKAAVRQWLFEPVLLGSGAAEVETTVDIAFPMTLPCGVP